MYNGAADCRKIEFAAVVSLLASTNRITVAAYASPTSTVRRDKPRRAAGTNSRIAAAAIPERKLATCQLPSAQALIAAPPVENSKAANKTRISARRRSCMTRPSSDIKPTP